MINKRFFELLKPLGEFHCVKDLRRFNRVKKKNPKYSLAAYLGHFGHCKNGLYHVCSFDLHPKTQHDVIYYYRTDEVNGQRVRRRGGKPMNMAGRGRPPRRHIRNTSNKS